MAPLQIRTEVQVMFFDTDCGGVVSNIAYLRFIDNARTRHVDELGLALTVLTENHTSPVAVHTGIHGAAHAARAVCDSNCVSRSVERGDDWHGRPVQPNRGTICRSGPRDGRDPSMAPADERRYPAPAKTAVALLAHYCLV